MKSPPPPVETLWLEETLRDFFESEPHLSSPDESPSRDFRERCLEAGRCAADIARLRAQRPKLAAILSPLDSHFRALAQLAGVKIEQLFAGLGIRRPKGPGMADMRGLARLAQALGLSCPETDLRLRLGFADGNPAVGCLLSAAQPAPGIARRSNRSPEVRIESALHECESAYSDAQRARLRKARATVAVVFDGAET